MSKQIYGRDETAELGDATTLVRVRIPFSSDTANGGNIAETLVSRAVAPNEPSVANRAIRGILFQTVGKFYGYAIVAVGLALRTQSFNKTTYGDYGIVFIYLGFVSVLADAGIMYTTVREASRFPEQLEKVLSATFMLKLLCATFMYGLGITIGFFMPYDNDVKIAIAIVGASMCLVNICGAFDVAFLSRIQIAYPTMADVMLKNIVFIGTLGLFIYATASHSSPAKQTEFFYIMIGVNVLANIVNSLIYWYGGSRLARLRLHIDWGYCRMLFLGSLPMAIVGILGQIYLKADSLLLSVSRTPAEVAPYNVAYRVVDILMIFFAVFSNIMFPILARYSEQSEERYARAIQRVLNICVTISFPIAIGVALTAPEIVAILARNYPEAVFPLVMLALSLIASFMNMILSYIIIIQNKQRNLIWVFVLNIIVNVGLNLYAIPRYSFNGSAVATVITETQGVLLVFFVINRYHRARPTLGIITKTLLASALMIGVVLVLRHLVPSHLTRFNSTIAAAIGAAVYGGAGVTIYVTTLYLLGGIDPGVLQQLTQRVPFFTKFLKVRAS